MEEVYEKTIIEALNKDPAVALRDIAGAASKAAIRTKKRLVGPWGRIKYVTKRLKMRLRGDYVWPSNSRAPNDDSKFITENMERAFRKLPLISFEEATAPTISLTKTVKDIAEKYELDQPTGNLSIHEFRMKLKADADLKEMEFEELKAVTEESQGPPRWGDMTEKRYNRLTKQSNIEIVKVQQEIVRNRIEFPRNLTEFTQDYRGVKR